MGDEFIVKPTLTSGVLFNLLLRAKKPGNIISKNPVGKSLYVIEPELLEGFTAIIVPKQDRSSMQSSMGVDTSKFRAGQLSQAGWFPFMEDPVINEFEDAVLNHYHETLYRVISFCEEYCAHDGDTFAMIGKVILGVIKSDPGISDETELYINDKGLPIKKKDIKEDDDYCFQAVFLGALHWVICNKIPNDNIDFCSVLRGSISLKNIFDNFGSSFRKARIYVSEYQEEEAKRISELQETNTEKQIRHRFNNYMHRAKEHYSSIKTLLTEGELVDFRSVYVPNHLLLQKRAFIRKREDGEFDSKDAYGEGTNPSYASISCPRPKTIRKYLKKNLIIQGDGGIGKSMMARHLFLAAIEDYESERQIPIFVALKEYDSSCSDFDEFVWQRVKRFDDARKPFIREEDYINAASMGHFLLIFDGLDEIDSSLSQRFNEGLEAFKIKYDKCQFIITSRANSKSGFANFQDFWICKILRFDLDQSLELAKNEHWDVPKEKRDKFCRELSGRLFQSHHEFASNPLLLTIMMFTFEDFEDIPSRMHLFYKEAYESLSVKHDERKGYKRKMSTPLTHEAFTSLLECFCMITQYEQKYVFDETSFNQYFLRAKEMMGYKQELFAKDFIDDLQNNICLLYEEGRKYYFVHRSFQEYFCASYFSKQPDHTLTRVGEEFEDRETDSGEVLQMVCDLRPEAAEIYIYLPFIEKHFAGEDNSLWFYTFLYECYGTIDAYTGELGLPRNKAVPCSPTYRIIKQKLGFPDIVVDFLPIIADFVEEAYCPMIDDNGVTSIHSFGQYNYPVRTTNGDVIDLEDTHSSIDFFELFGPAQDPETEAAIAALYHSQFGEEMKALLLYGARLKRRKEQSEASEDFLSVFSRKDIGE